MSTYARLLCMSLACAASAAGAQNVTIQAEEPGSSVYLYAGLFESVIEGATDIEVDIIPRGGSVTNTATTNAGRNDFAFANALPLAWGWKGIQDFDGKPQTNNRLVFSGMQVAFLSATAATDYVEKTGNKTVADALAGDGAAKVLVEPTGSINPVVLDLYLQSKGSSLEDQRSKGTIAQVPSSQMGQRAQDDFANAYFGMGPIGNPDLTEIILGRPMTFLTWSDADLAAMAEYGLVKATLPAGSYDGQSEDVVLPAALNDFIANKDVDEETVYQVTKAIVDNIEQLAASNKVFASWDVQTYVQPEYQIIPLHPGAERYYRERGWIK